MKSFVFGILGTYSFYKNVMSRRILTLCVLLFLAVVKLPHVSGQVTLTEIAEAIKLTCAAYKLIIHIFGTVRTVDYKRVINLGFEHFAEKSQVLKLLNVSSESQSDLINGIVKAYNIPEDQKDDLFLMQFTAQGTWIGTSILFSPSNNDQYKSLAVYRSMDPKTGVADYLVVDVQESFQLAPDILVKHTHTSELGGIFASDKYEYTKIPHALSVDDTKILMDFFAYSVATAMSEVLPQIA
jgi:hypothetical protein